MREEKGYPEINSSDFFKALYDSYLCGIIQYYGSNRRYRTIGMNRMAQEICGTELPKTYFEENYVGIGHFVEKDYKEAYIAGIDSLDKPEAVVSYESVVRKKDGGNTWIIGEARLVSCENGQKHIVCIFMNINKRKEYEESLRRERDRYNELLQNVPCAIVQYDFNGGIRHIRSLNDEVWRLLNFKSREEYKAAAKGGAVSKVYEEDIPYTQMLFERMNKSSKPIEFTHRLVCGDGEVKWIHGCSELRYGEDGEKYYQCVFMDDTIRLEEELKKENEYKKELSRMSAVSENTISRIRFNVSDNKIEQYKPKEGIAIPKADKMSYDEFAAAEVERIVDEEERELVRGAVTRKALEQSFREGETSFEIEFRRKMQDGKNAWVMMQIRLVKEPNTKKLIGFWYLRTENRSSLKRLSAFEKAYEALKADAARSEEKMKELKEQGKTNSVTFKQLLTKKVTAENTLKLLELYGIED